MKKRVFSGIQPSGMTHIGNYLGAIVQWVASQDERENIFCVVDLHALTVPHDPQQLREHSRQLAAILFAAGIDPQKSALFLQSQVSQHAELAWIMNCIASMGHMKRMTQFKQKSEKMRDKASVGLFTYPALMAADILLYQTHEVPVGADQKQHVELTRDLAQRFNERFGETFTLPEPIIPKAGARVMGLDDPTKKMSKSDSSKWHAVGVLDSPELILKKFRKAATDSSTDIVFDPERPGVFNLLSVYQVITGKSQESIEAEFSGKGYGDLKTAIAEAVIEELRPLQERYQEIEKDQTQLDQYLQAGVEKVAPIAAATMEKVNRNLGVG